MGRKRDGFWYNLYGQSNAKSGCLVPQEQLNAWIHINGQKSCTQGLPKRPPSDIESDCRVYLSCFVPLILVMIGCSIILKNSKILIINPFCHQNGAFLL